MWQKALLLIVMMLLVPVSSFVYGYTCEEKYQYCKYDLPNSCSSSDNCSWEIQQCWDEYYGTDGCGTQNPNYGGYSNWDEYCKATYGSDTYYDASTDTCERKRFEFNIDVETFSSVPQNIPVEIPIYIYSIKGTPQEVNLWTADWSYVGINSWIAPNPAWPSDDTSASSLWIQPSCATPPDQYQFGVHGDTAGTTFTSVDSVTVQVTPGDCSKNSNIYSTQVNRAKDLVESGNYQDAVNVLYDVLMEDPNNIDALLVEADAVTKMGYPDDAISYYDQVIANEPNNVIALSNKASLLIDLERYDEALDAYQKVISLDPSDSLAYNNIGVIFGNQGDYEEALKHFEYAHEIDPNNSLYSENIEFIQEKLRKLSSSDDENQEYSGLQVKSFFLSGGKKGEICNYKINSDNPCRDLDGKLQPGDIIITNNDNYAVIELDKGQSRILLGPNTEMGVVHISEKLRAFYFPSNISTMKATINSPEGVDTKFGMCDDLADEQCTLEKIGFWTWIKGTELVIERNPANKITQIIVFEGNVELEDVENPSNSLIIETNNQLEIKNMDNRNIFLTKQLDPESIVKWWSEPEDHIQKLNNDLQNDLGNNETYDNGGGCLIATATYGSELAPQVQQLRELRDNSLLQTESGSSFMKSFNQFYYSFSPTIADYERENPLFKEIVKIALTPLISSLSILNYVDMDSESSVLGYGISLILLNVGMYVGIPIFSIVMIRKKF